MIWMTWRPNGSRLRRMGALVSVLTLCAPFVGSISTLAVPSNELDEHRLENTVRFLQQAQNSDGGFGGEAGEESSQLFSAWVALALAAASVNPQDQAKRGGQSVYTYLSEHVQQAIRAELCKPIICTTAFERELLVVDASGTAPENYGGIDLVSELLARKLPDGSFPFVPGGRGEVNDTIFAILSLSPIAEPAIQEATKRAARWVIAQQNAEGSWSWQNKGSPGEADMTGAAIEALNAAGMPNTDAQQKAIEYLHEVQEPDGGFPEFGSEGESNAGSTAWATQGIWAAGENPEAHSWVKLSSGHGPLDYLESMQQPDGHIRYRASAEINGVWMTAYTGPAYAGQQLPIPSPARNLAPPTSPSPPSQGGEGSQVGSGVIAGGGGNGAFLFSRPQPGSKGHTAGGVRQLENGHHHSKAKHRRDPGPRRKAPVLTASSLGVHSPKRRNANRKGTGAVRLGSTGIGTGGGVKKSSGQEVRGLIVGAPTGELGSGAPGLHSAGAGVNRTQWLAITIAGAALLLAFSGWLVELRRPQVIL
jgi:hypothetical protein